MSITPEEISRLIGQPESETLQYKAVLPPSKYIAKMISAFANTNGGYLVLGALGNGQVAGLSADFHAHTITHKAIDLVSPKPIIYYDYVEYLGKKIFVIKVEKSDQTIYVENKSFVRKNTSVEDPNEAKVQFSAKVYPRIKTISDEIEILKRGSLTSAKQKLLEHYQSILKLIDKSSSVLYPDKPEAATTLAEGKVFTRMLFSSGVDNFETYLSDLLYEIFLAKPETLKSSTQKVSIEEVLNCADLQEFVKYWAKEKLSKLQKGSVKGFTEENKQIQTLGVLDATKQSDIDNILQIRHLYTHRNGIIDEKFLKYFSGHPLNTEHQLSIKEVLDKFDYLVTIVNELDEAAIKKYSLVTI